MVFVSLFLWFQVGALQYMTWHFAGGLLAGMSAVLYVTALLDIARAQAVCIRGFPIQGRGSANTCCALMSDNAAAERSWRKLLSS